MATSSNVPVCFTSSPVVFENCWHCYNIFSHTSQLINTSSSAEYSVVLLVRRQIDQSWMSCCLCSAKTVSFISPWVKQGILSALVEYQDAKLLRNDAWKYKFSETRGNFISPVKNATIHDFYLLLFIIVRFGTYWVEEKQERRVSNSLFASSTGFKPALTELHEFPELWNLKLSCSNRTVSKLVAPKTYVAFTCSKFFFGQLWITFNCRAESTSWWIKVFR